MTMSDVFAVSQLTKALWALIGFALVFGVIRLSEFAIKLDIEKVVNGIESDPLASAIYLGLRFIGACLLVGWLLS